jgi:hypothetical protein
MSHSQVAQGRQLSHAQPRTDKTVASLVLDMLKEHGVTSLKRGNAVSVRIRQSCCLQSTTRWYAYSPNFGCADAVSRK